jgi:hypothetical protein
MRRSRQGVIGAVVVAMLAVATTAGVGGFGRGGLALAAKCAVPSFRPVNSEPSGAPTKYEAHATRVNVDTQIVEGQSPCSRTVTTEYATKPGGPWMPIQKEQYSAGVQNVSLGEPLFQSNGPKLLQHLTPDTQYYVRFTAENEAGTGSLTVPFKTTELEQPEFGIEGASFENVGARGTHVFNLYYSPELTTTSDSISASLPMETNGSDTHYQVSYSSQSRSGPWTVFAAHGEGEVTAAEDYALPPSAVATGLSPETRYFVRLLAENAIGKTEEILEPSTSTRHPLVGGPEIANVTATTVRAQFNIVPQSTEVHWRFEQAPAAAGPWSAVPGGAGTISSREAEALSGGDGVPVASVLSGLSPATSYYVRVSAENAFGESAVNRANEPVTSQQEGFIVLKTAGSPQAAAFPAHGIDTAGVRVLGDVSPNDATTDAEQEVVIGGHPTGGTFTLSYHGETTEPIPYDAPASEVFAESVEGALRALPAVKGKVGLRVVGPEGGPYRIVFDTGTAEEVVAGDGSGLTPGEPVTATTTQPGGVSYHATASVEYTTQTQYAEHGFAGASKTSEVSITPQRLQTVSANSNTYSSFHTTPIGIQLPSLTPGVTYEYRLHIASEVPGSSAGFSEPHTVVVPVVGPPGPESCPNAAVRTGFAAQLPDCRAYEQVTPTEKEGTQEIANYGGTTLGGATIGEDGEHALLEALPVKWKGGEGPYVFSRGATGWQTSSISTELENGAETYVPQLISPTLERIAIRSTWQTSPVSTNRKISYETGPPGGPYAKVASVPFLSSDEEEGWVASSRDFSTLVLATQDRSLLGKATGTHEGTDLYAYAGGALRQVNVTGAGATIGKCGARMAVGEEGASRDYTVLSSANAVSEDGSRVFFEAVPGSDCDEQSHLFVRVGGGETRDLGAYRFLGGNRAGTRVLVSHEANGSVEISLDDLESGDLQPLVTVPGFEGFQANVRVAEDEPAVFYLIATAQLTPEAPASKGENDEGDLYRYDHGLEFIGHLVYGEMRDASASGANLYFTAGELGGLPGGAIPAHGSRPVEDYRFDSSESAVQCVSCASPFDPEPELESLYTQQGGSAGVRVSRQGLPAELEASENGDYVFFDAQSALLPNDIDGETLPPSTNAEGGRLAYFSTSSDVYEWRRDGVDGCVELQGCLALITSGTGGYLNMLLGTTPSGRDVFFTAGLQLVSGDRDTALDIYDARIDGGFSPSAPPSECEGAACHHPPPEPLESTPASFAFSGPGNPVAPLTTNTSSPKSSPKKLKPSKRCVKSRSKHRRACKRVAAGRKKAGASRARQGRRTR